LESESSLLSILIINLNEKYRSSAYFDSELLHLSGAMTLQSIIKHFLTEGDKFLISYFSPLEDQGGYALASNYGMSTIHFA